LALALKLAEGEICREEFGDYPVFLFDDVLSELDGTRRDYLINKMSEKQVILTSCEVDFLSRITDTDVKKISVKDGIYE
jgi:DNA replication and repair protein RecF